MNERLYLDSNVLISFIREEFGFGLRYLMAEAQLFFEKAGFGKHLIVISWLSFKEVENKLKTSREETKEALSVFELNIEEAEFSKNDFVEAEKISNLGIHFQDAIHVAIALRAKCDAIVTFNIKDFEKAREKISVLEPADFL